MPISRQIATMVDSRIVIVTMSMGGLLRDRGCSRLHHPQIAPAVDADALVGPHYRHRGRLLDDRGAIDAVTVEQLVAEIDRHLRAATLEHHPAARGGPRLRL